MNDKQFDILLEFHLGLIRSRPMQKTIDAARKTINSNHSSDDIGASGNLISALRARLKSLTAWNDVGAGKVAIYNLNNTRNPSDGAFAGAFDVINDGKAISKAAKDNNVNYQSIKVLVPRLIRWNDFAKRLHDSA